MLIQQSIRNHAGDQNQWRHPQSSRKKETPELIQDETKTKK